MPTQFAVFVKPWKGMEAAQMAAHVRQLGFDLIELPVRPGFPCEPARMEQDLPQVIQAFAEQGVRVHNVTVELPLDDERLYAACAANGIRMNRVMFKRISVGYWESEAAARRQLDAALPLCERYGNSVPINSMGLYHLVKEYDPRYVGAIWDPAHNALQGEDPQAGLEMVQSHLCMVNLKNAYWQRVQASTDTRWEAHFTSGRAGRTSWREVAGI